MHNETSMHTETTMHYSYSQRRLCHIKTVYGIMAIAM